jgi:hypothetical protein
MITLLAYSNAVAYPPGAANLTGSTFDVANGDLTSTTLHDWNPAGSPSGNLGPIQTITCPSTVPGSGTNCGLDRTNSALDNSFSEGTKEDDSSVFIANGAIPPNKDDLSRFYINKETQKVANVDHLFLYMAWERTNTLGSAHLDFEFNQSPVGVTATSTGTVVLNRAAGDLLIDYDFGGSGPVVLTLHRWVVGTNTPSTDCEAVSSGTNVTCWGKGVALPPSIATASVNGANVTDYNAPSAPRTLAGSTVNKQNGGVTVSSTFGEAGLDLTAANIFPANRCFHLGDAWLKSRSAGSSFTSAMKDFIAPIPVSISNCGEVVIQKQTNPRGVNQNFTINSNIAGLDLSAGTASGVTSAACREAASGYAGSYTLNDNGNTTGNSTGNTNDCANVPIGNYTVSEGTDPSGFAFASVTCTWDDGATVNGFASTDSPKTFTSKSLTIHVAAGSLVTCVYTNNQQRGAIKVSKTSSKTGNAIAGAVFSVTGPNSFSATLTTGSDGTDCVDDLAFGDYTVTETSAPTGWDIDDTSGHPVTVGSNATCSDDPYQGGSTSFTDSPTYDLQVNFRDGGSGETSATISCTNVGTADTTAASGWDSSNTYTGETYIGDVVCTITVDP